MSKGWRGLIERMAAADWFARWGPKIVPRMDRFVHRVTGGRVLPSATFMPHVLLTAIGHRSGKPRTVPLMTFPMDDAFVVIGSNFGRDDHPAWSKNLIANPRATVEYRGETFPVEARLASAEEKAELWPRLRRRWPPVDTYAERSGRDIRLFFLERTDAPPA